MVTTLYWWEIISLVLTMALERGQRDPKVTLRKVCPESGLTASPNDRLIGSGQG